MPEFYVNHGTGAVVSFTINKYIYVSVNPRFEDGIRLSYSITEDVPTVDLLRHDIVRETLKFLGRLGKLEITSVADIPGKGTGLGSSSAFAVGLQNALLQSDYEKYHLANNAYYVEREKCGKPVGKQDHYASAYGGMNLLRFESNGVYVMPLVSIPLHEIERKCLLLYTGITRRSKEILASQAYNLGNDRDTIETAKKMAAMAEILYADLQIGRDTIGQYLHKNWELKKKLTGKISTPDLDLIYKSALAVGAEGGKLCFLPETKIKTLHGKTTNYNNIQDIVVGQQIFDHTNSIQVVHEKHERLYSGEIIRFGIKGISSKIECTPEHPFFVSYKPQSGYKRNEMKIPTYGRFVEAKNLEKGDCVLMPIDDRINDVDAINLNDFVEIEQSKYSNTNIWDGINKRTKVSDEFLELIGWYTAEGSASIKQLQITLSKDEKKEANRIQDCFVKVFSKTSTISYSESSHSLNVVVSSKVIAKLFKILCGYGAASKHIPDFCYHLPLKQQKILLKSLWSGDGCVSIKHDKRTNSDYVVASYKTISIRLAKEVQHLCHRLGYITSLMEYIPKDMVRQKTYTVSIHGDDALAFSQYMNTGIVFNVSRRNRKKLSIRKNIVEIDSVRYIKRSIMSKETEKYHGVVYNLSVTGNNSYTVEDIAVHNCGAGGGGFFLFYAPPEKHADIVEATGLRPVDFKIEPEGSKIIYAD